MELIRIQDTISLVTCHVRMVSESQTGPAEMWGDKATLRWIQ
jgi:hypothetical protein